MSVRLTECRLPSPSLPPSSCAYVMGSFLGGPGGGGARRVCGAAAHSLRRRRLLLGAQRLRHSRGPRAEPKLYGVRVANRKLGNMTLKKY